MSLEREETTRIINLSSFYIKEEILQSKDDSRRSYLDILLIFPDFRINWRHFLGFWPDCFICWRQWLLLLGHHISTTLLQTNLQDSNRYSSLSFYPSDSQFRHSRRLPTQCKNTLLYRLSWTPPHLSRAFPVQDWELICWRWEISDRTTLWWIWLSNMNE